MALHPLNPQSQALRSLWGYRGSSFPPLHWELPSETQIPLYNRQPGVDKTLQPNIIEWVGLSWASKVI